jgi:chromosome segregation ATPase
MEEEGYKKLINGSVINSLKNLEDKLEKNDPSYSDELAALPSGHPLRTAIEDAKQRREERLSREESVKKTSARIRENRMAKKVKSAEKRKERDTITQDEVGQGRSAVDDLNKKIESLRMASADLLRAIPKIKDDLQKFPDEMTKLSRLERIVGSIHKGMSETNFNKIRITGEE